MIEKRLAELGLELPKPPTPAANYIPWIVSGNHIYFAGQTPKVGAELKYTGQVGSELSIEQGYDAAKLCATRLLSALREAAGGFENVHRIVKLTVFVNSSAAFEEHAKVGNGASDLLCALFGEAGVHVRSAVGASSLPGNAAVEVEMIAELE